MGNPAVKFLRTRPRASPAPKSINPGEDSFSSRFLTLPIPEAMGADWGLTVNKQPTWLSVNESQNIPVRPSCANSGVGKSPCQ